MKKVKLRLSQTQLSALHDLFADHIIGDKPTDDNEALVLLHMIDIYKKLRDRNENSRAGKGAALTLSHKEAIAYKVYFMGRHFGNNYVFEHNFLRSHLALIDRVYA